jgi:hypothetical protein
MEVLPNLTPLDLLIIEEARGALHRLHTFKQPAVSDTEAGLLSIWKDVHMHCQQSKLCTKLTLHFNHISGHLKTEHTESLFLLRRHVGIWPRSKHEKPNAGSA